MRARCTEGRSIYTVLMLRTDQAVLGALAGNNRGWSNNRTRWNNREPEIGDRTIENENNSGKQWIMENNKVDAFRTGAWA